jgi:hypothetical protein
MAKRGMGGQEMIRWVAKKRKVAKREMGGQEKISG